MSHWPAPHVRPGERAFSRLGRSAADTDPGPPLLVPVAARAHAPRDVIARAGLLAEHQPAETEAERTCDEQTRHRIRVTDGASGLPVVARAVPRGIIPDLRSPASRAP